MEYEFAGSSNLTSALNEANVPIYDHDLCHDYYGVPVDDGVICIVPNNAADCVCSGESGGPMNYFVNGIYFIRGVMSFGPSAGCGPDIPEAFCRVEYYLDWISSHTGIVIDS